MEQNNTQGQELQGLAPEDGVLASFLEEMETRIEAIEKKLGIQSSADEPQGDVNTTLSK